MRRAILRGSLIFAALSSTALGVLAADVDTAGAQHLKALFEGIMNRKAEQVSAKNDKDPNTTRKLEHDGEIIVEPAGDYYAITLPRTTLHMSEKNTKTGATETTKVRLGMISINATPNPHPKLWNMTVAVPTPIITTDGQEQEKLRINIGSQKAAGLWHEDLEEFVVLDAAYNNISVGNADKANVAMIDSAILDYDLKEDGEGRWSGPAKTVMTGISIGAPESTSALNLDRAEFNFNASQLDAASRKKLTELATSETSVSAEKWLAALMDIADGASMSANLNGLDITKGKSDLFKGILEASAGALDGASSLHLGNLTAALKVNGLRQDKAATELHLSYAGLKKEGAEKIDEKLLPASFEVKLAPQNIPLKQIADVMRNELSTTQTISPVSLLIKVPALLSNAGTVIDLTGHFGNDFYRLETKGQAKANIVAKSGATLNVITTLSNLDGLLKHVQDTAAQPDHPKAQDYKTLSGTLVTLKEIGVAEESGGKTLHKFELVMDEKGEILLNGKPAMPILSQLKFPKGLI